MREGYNVPAGGNRGGANLRAASFAAASSTTLSDVEIHSLLFMREEEKLARDVYAVLYETYGEQIFLNIMASEQTHFDQMGVLLERYGLEDPALEPGLYTDDYIQGLYDMLIPMGLVSLEGAYRVGAIIEEVDILDFLHFLEDEEVDNRDIRQVYTEPDECLREPSARLCHLPAVHRGGV